MLEFEYKNIYNHHVKVFVYDDSTGLIILDDNEKLRYYFDLDSFYYTENFVDFTDVEQYETIRRVIEDVFKQHYEMLKYIEVKNDRK